MKDVCYIKLYNRQKEIVGETVIDREDCYKIKGRSLYLQRVTANYVEVRYGRHSKLHHLIHGKPAKGMVTDHLDRDTLNNCKSNLRFVTFSQNCINRSPYKGRSSIYKGVCWDKNKCRWMVRIKGIFLGRFKDEVKAALVYDKRAKELFGKYAVLNF